MFHKVASDTVRKRWKLKRRLYYNFGEIIVKVGHDSAKLYGNTPRDRSINGNIVTQEDEQPDLLHP